MSQSKSPTKTIKRFYWFTTHSWSYMQGQRGNFLTGFWKAWIHFNNASKNDEASHEI